MRGIWVLLLFAAGCGITNVDLDEPIPEQTIAGSNLPVGLGAFFQFPIHLNIQQDLDAMKTGTASSVKLTSIAVTITDAARPQGDSDDWSFVDSIDVYVESTKSGTTLERKKVATITSPGAVETMDFTIVPDVELLPYVQEGVEMTTDSSGTEPPDDVSFDGTASFTVDVI